MIFACYNRKKKCDESFLNGKSLNFKTTVICAEVKKINFFARIEFDVVSLLIVVVNIILKQWFSTSVQRAAQKPIEFLITADRLLIYLLSLILLFCIYKIQNDTFFF